MNEEQAVCLNCGVENGTGKKYCPNCGKEIAAEEAVICVGCGVSLKKTKNVSVQVDAEAAAKIQPRDLVKAIILSIVTCGIYGIIWYIKLTNELNMLCKEANDKRAALASFLLLLLAAYTTSSGHTSTVQRRIRSQARTTIVQLSTLFSVSSVLASLHMPCFRMQ